MSGLMLSLLIILLACIPVATFGAVYTGSGFFVTQDGYFITNYHVIRGASEIQLRDLKGSLHNAVIIRTDKANDLAILKADGNFNYLPIANSRGARRGTSVITVGYPHIDVQGLEPKVTEGIINSLSGIGDDPRVFQISAPVQAGNSGGPLVTNEGNVIGIVIGKLSANTMLKETGDMPQNVNYAVKSNYLSEFISSIPELDQKLKNANTKKLGSMADLTAYVEKATAIVIAEQLVTKSNVVVQGPALPSHRQPINRTPQPHHNIAEQPTYSLDNPPIKYPMMANIQGIEGRVTVRVEVLANGLPGRMWLKQGSGSNLLDQDAQEQLKHWRFVPARKNGQPVSAWIDVPVVYHLSEANKR